MLTHVVGAVYAGEAGRQTSHHNTGFSPLYISVCARLECGYSVYVCTHEYSVRKAYSSRYVTFAFARTSWAPETEENRSCTEDGTKALRKPLGYVSTSLTSWWQFFFYKFCLLRCCSPHLKNIAVPCGFNMEALINILQRRMNRVSQQHSMPLSSLCRQRFGKEQEGDQLYAMKQA